MSSDDIELQRQMMKRIDENVRRRLEAELRADALELDSRTEPIESMPGYVSGEFSGDDLGSAAERFPDIGRRMSDAFRPFVAEFRTPQDEHAERELREEILGDQQPDPTPTHEPSAHDMVIADMGKRMVEAFEPFAAQLRETFDRIAKAIEDNPDLFTGPRGPIHPKDVRDENGIPKPSPMAPFWTQSHNRHSVNRGSNRGRTGGRNR